MDRRNREKLPKLTYPPVKAREIPMTHVAACDIEVPCVWGCNCPTMIRFERTAYSYVTPIPTDRSWHQDSDPGYTSQRVTFTHGEHSREFDYQQWIRGDAVRFLESLHG